MKATQSTPSCDANGIVIKDISSDTQVNYSGEKYTGYVLDKSTLLACPEVIPSFDCDTAEIFKEWSHSAWDDFHHAYLIISDHTDFRNRGVERDFTGKRSLLLHRKTSFKKTP